MFSKIQDPFLRALLHAIVGGLAGIVFGFLFGLIVVGVGFLLDAGTTMGIRNFAAISPLLMICMGFGSMVGAFLAGLIGARPQK